MDLNPTVIRPKVKRLSELLLSIEDPREMEKFIEDFFTPSEIDHLLERWDLVSELLKGKTQRQVRDELKVSISKVTRGAHALKYGRGGLLSVWKRGKHPPSLEASS